MSYTREHQPMIPNNFKDMNGNYWPKSWIDTYNRYTEDLNKYAGQQIEHGSMTDNAINFTLDQRHRYFVECCDIAKNKEL